MILIKKIELLFVILAVFIFADFGFAQSAKKDCFEVKHFDFFGLRDETKINWSDEELNQLLSLKELQNGNKTSFLIPPIVFQLKEFHPNCNKSFDKERFNKLAAIYFKIREINVSILKNKNIAEQLNFIRDDYYSQLQDARLLSRMKYTMDDGPLYGEIPKDASTFQVLDSIIANFGKLTITSSNNQIVLTATDKGNKTIWRRIMTGTNSDRYLKNLKFDGSNIEKTSLATVFHFSSEGERLLLYVKPNGEFMYYSHSW